MLIVMTPALPLVERKRRQARQRIIQAAEEAFLARGFNEVSVGDIAERAELGRTTFFRHFGDKQEVVFARGQELLETIAVAGQADGAPAPRSAGEAVEQLRPSILALCDQAASDPEAYTRHYQFIEQHPELRDRDAVKMQQVAEKLSDLWSTADPTKPPPSSQDKSPSPVPDRQAPRQQPAHPGGRDPGRLQTSTHTPDRCR